MATTVVVGIGRNVGDEPMSDERWADFRAATADEVFFASGKLHFEGEGTGYFEGRAERSYTLVATVENPVGLYHALADLAREFNQDSIALTTGNTSFPGSEA